MGHHAAKTELRAMKTALKYQYKAILVYEYFANCNKIGILKLSCEHNVNFVLQSNTLKGNDNTKDHQQHRGCDVRHRGIVGHAFRRMWFKRNVFIRGEREDVIPKRTAITDKHGR